LTIRFKYLGSYQEVERKNLVIEVWKYGKLSINTFLGSFETPLIKLITGNILRNDYVVKSEEGRERSRILAGYFDFHRSIFAQLPLLLPGDLKLQTRVCGFENNESAVVRWDTVQSVRGFDDAQQGVLFLKQVGFYLCTTATEEPILRKNQRTHFFQRGTF